MIGPFFAAFIPIFTLSYLHKLSRIIKQTRLKEYLNELKLIVFPLYLKLKDNNDLQSKIITINPNKSERLKHLLWNFIKIKFKYTLIKKLDYNFSSLYDIEVFYDEVLELYLYKFDQY